MNIKNLTFKGTEWVISLFILVSLLFDLFGNTDFTLTNFSELYISQATLDGVDATKRISLFFKIVFLSIIIFPIIHLLFLKLKGLNIIRLADIKVLTVISTTGFFLILTNILGVQNDTSIKLFKGLFAFTVLGIGINHFLKQQFHFSYLFPYLITLTAPLFLFILFLFNPNHVIYNHTLSTFFILLLLTSIIFHTSHSYLKVSFKRLFQFSLFIPLIPIISFFLIELQFWFKATQNAFIPYKFLLVGLLILSVIAAFILTRKNIISCSTSQLFKCFYIPSALISILILIFYSPFQSQPVEIFELANRANALMKIFKFGEVPFIDFFSSHMISDYLFGSIYTVFFGYTENLDFLSYNFIYSVIIYFIVYYFNQKLFSPFLAILFTLSFPFFSTLYYHSMIFCLLLFFAFQKLIKEQTVKNYLIIFSLVIGLILWRLDSGIAALLTMIIFFPLIFYIHGKKVSFSILVKSLLIISAVLIPIIIVAAIFKSPQLLWANFNSAIHYLKANQAHAYSILVQNESHQFYLFHFFIPLFALICIFYITNLLKNSKEKFSAIYQYMLTSSLFLFIVFFANFQRGLIRHGFMELLEGFLLSTFYLALVLFLTAIIQPKNVVVRYIVFFSLSFSSIILIKYFPIKTGETPLEKLFTRSTLKDLDKSFNPSYYSTRVIENKEFTAYNYINLKHFLDNTINQNQTFLDFSNTPMLYYYCQRNVPGYFCQNLQNTVDDYLQIEHLKMITSSYVPITIYSNYPPSGFDNMDGVPGTMRHYLIAEYIYSHYKPYQIINHRSIWVTPELNLPDHGNEQDTIVSKPQTHHYKYAASAIQNHFNLSDNSSNLELLETIRLTTSNAQVSIDSNISHQAHLFLKITLKQPIDQQNINVEILNGENLIGVNTFIASSQYDSYMVRLSNHYLWHLQQATSIRINTNYNTIETIDFYKDLRLEDTK
jgi:hypothetical protein